MSFTDFHKLIQEIKAMKVLVIFCLFSSSAFSQVYYKIPWATIQPQFVFPIYFEDGAGQRDTLYLGYDDSASSFAFEMVDSVFGVHPIQLDTSKFHAIWGYTFCGPAPCLEGFKANVTSLNTWLGFSSFSQVAEFYLIKGIMPLKISWDKQLFYSDSLPFQNHINGPRGQGRLYVGCSFCLVRENGVQVPSVNGGQYYICDTSCTVKDSVVVYNIFGQIDSLHHSAFFFYIQGWTNGILGISKQATSDSDIKFEMENNQINIFNYGNHHAKVRIIDLLGRVYINDEVASHSSTSFSLPIPTLLIAQVYNHKFNLSVKLYQHDRY